jgi:hypothetical protein
MKAGREKIGAERFNEFAAYVMGLQAQKKIDSFEPVILRPHGGDLNGFFLIRGDAARLSELKTTDAWKDWEVWGTLNLEGYGVNEAVLGEGVVEMIQRYAKQAAK